MFTNHNTKDIYEKKVENGGDADRRERERLLKQEAAVHKCSSRWVFLKNLQYS